MSRSFSARPPWAASKKKAGAVKARKTFDRWANSRDFVFTPVPHDDLTVKAFLAAVESEHKAGHYNTGWGEERDLYAAYRRERKRLRAELRIAETDNETELAA